MLGFLHVLAIDFPTTEVDAHPKAWVIIGECEDGAMKLGHGADQA